LIHGEWKERSIFYRPQLQFVRAMTVFLLKDCCEGRPELCEPVIADLVPCCKGRGPPMADRIFKVPFLCTGNSARSIMAEAILNKLGSGKFRAFSAGSHPQGAVHPLARKELERLGLPTDGLASKSWDVFAAPDAPRMDFIFTVCDNAAGETCPQWPGRPVTAHWGIEDPTAVEGTDLQKEAAFARAAGYLRNRIAAFLSLPLRSLDALALERRMREIGQKRDESNDD
jgi:arsenate reductase